MFTTLLTIALFVAPTIQGAFAEFAISTPELVQCQDATISWQPTKGPYNLIIVNAQDPCGDALLDLGDHDGTVFTLKAALPAGHKVQLSLEDANGDEAWSGQITVKSSSDSSCIPSKLKSSESSSFPASPSAATTLVVPPSRTGAATSSSVVPSAVGAANAGTAPFSNGAFTMRQVNTPVMIISAFAAVIALYI